MIDLLWITFIAGQIFSTGNMIHQQEIGMYEINPIYGRHPSKERIIITKVVEIGGVYWATKKFRKHKVKILKGSNACVFGFIIDDKRRGVSMSWTL